MRIIFLLAIVGGVTLFATPRSPKVPSFVLSVEAQEKYGSISGIVTGPDSTTIFAARITAVLQTSAGAAAPAHLWLIRIKAGAFGLIHCLRASTNCKW